jgi:EAL and modified HD-GYP domain-containing signal transduction protein
MKNNDILFCRETVVNSLSQTMAYHILHPKNAAIDIENSFLNSIFFDVDINEITHQKTFFIEMSIEELSNLPLHKNACMIIFLNTQALSEKNHLDMLNDLRLQGFQLGIINPDPKVLSGDFLSIFSYVLFSSDSLPINTIIEHCSHSLLEHKNLWINKIETSDQFTLMKDCIPNAYFSGDFIKKTTPIKGKKVLNYKTILFDLLTELNNSDTSIQVLAACIERDPALTYRIIKLTHTSIYHSQFNISTAQRAVEIIGIRDLIKWASLVMLASISGKPASLVSMAISRAFFCQNISEVLFPKSNGAFLVGLFSFLPSFFDEDLPILLKELPIDESIKAALLEYSGNLGGVLKIVEAYEAGRWEKIPFKQLEYKGISKQALKELYVESLRRAREVSSL